MSPSRQKKIELQAGRLKRLPVLLQNTDKGLKFEIQETWIWKLDVSLRSNASCLTLAKLLKFSKPQFPHPESENDNDNSQCYNNKMRDKRKTWSIWLSSQCSVNDNDYYSQIIGIEAIRHRIDIFFSCRTRMNHKK